MGACFSYCVRCLTYCADRYTDACWDYSNDNPYPQISLNDTKSADNTTTKSIHAAVIDRDINAIRAILSTDYRTGLEEVNSSGETALHMACHLGYRVVINCLLTSPASSIMVQLVTDIGTPIHSVIRAVNSRNLSDNAGFSVMLTLIDLGCNVDASDKEGRTALFRAVEIGSLPCVQMLLQVGASVNKPDLRSFTPLYMASVQGDLGCVVELLSAPDVDVNYTDDFGRTSLVASLVFMNHYIQEDIVQSLTLEKHESRKAEGLVVRYNWIAIVEALLAAGIGELSAVYIIIGHHGCVQYRNSLQTFRNSCVLEIGNIANVSILNAAHMCHKKVEHKFQSIDRQ